jgi:Zn-dependent protease with chaperone function
MSAIWTHALVEFLWQGCVLGLGVALLRACAPTAAWRYRIAFLGLLAAPIWVIATCARGLQPASAPGVAAAWQVQVFWVWSVGAGLLLLRLAGGWWRLQSLRQRCVPLGAAAQARLGELADRMGLRRVPQLVEAAWADGPLTIGWLRPIVVVPLGFMTAMPPAWIDALLAHELAHVMRRDFLHGLLQRAIEALLFFHPVIWWLSRTLTRERELCCDDAVIHRLANRRAYVSGLARLAEQRAASVLAPAAHGGSLVQRIERLVRPRPARHARPFLAVVGLLLLCLPAWADAPAPTGVRWLPEAVQQHAAHFKAAAQAHDVDPRVLAVMTYMESRGKRTAVSSMGSRGLMQIMPATAKRIAKARGLTFTPKMLDEPATNIDFGAWYLKQQLVQFKDIEVAVAAYNGGPGHVRQWLSGKGKLRPETKKYVQTFSKLWSRRDAATRE